MNPMLRDIFSSLFDLPADKFADGLAQADVPGWDSMSHLSLVLALEQAFGVSFQPEEAVSLTSVAAIKRLLAGRRGAGVPPVAH